MNENDLKPCPFCGGKGLLWPSYPSGWQIGCANDDCEVQCWVSSRKDESAAAAVWNQRAALTPPEGFALVPVDPDCAELPNYAAGLWNRRNWQAALDDLLPDHPEAP